MRTYCIAMLLAIGAPAAAQDAKPITVGEFMARLATAKASIQSTQMTPELQELVQLFGETVKGYKETLDADAKAGKSPRACPVKGSTDTFNFDEVVDSLNAIPAEKRATMPLRDGVYAFLDKRYPCAG